MNIFRGFTARGPQYKDECKSDIIFFVTFLHHRAYSEFHEGNKRLKGGEEGECILGTTESPPRPAPLHPDL